MKKVPSYLCSSCKNEFPFEKIRYSNDGRTVVCIDCFKKNKIIQEKKISAGSGAIASDSIKLVCNNCHYKFSVKKGSKTKIMCPYCGKNEAVEDDTTADRLIDEAARIPEDYRDRAKFR